MRELWLVENRVWLQYTCLDDVIETYVTPISLIVNPHKNQTSHGKTKDLDFPHVLHVGRP